MVVRMRHTRSQRGKQRSHQALTGTRLSVIKEGAVHPRHKALLDGTPYRGRSVMDLSARRSVRSQKADKGSKK